MWVWLIFNFCVVEKCSHKELMLYLAAISVSVYLTVSFSHPWIVSGGMRGVQYRQKYLNIWSQVDDAVWGIMELVQVWGFLEEVLIGFELS